jgi:hypothetical protein
VQHEVLVLPVGKHDADGVSGAHLHAVLDTPGVGGGIDVDPPGKVLAVEQIAELGNAGAPDRGGQEEKAHRQDCDSTSFHGVSTSQ